jgi:GNAT superfamily N-acetyltransferase
MTGRPLSSRRACVRACHREIDPALVEEEELYVAREAQGAGAGRLLLDTALAWLEGGLRSVWHVTDMLA